MKDFFKGSLREKITLNMWLLAALCALLSSVFPSLMLAESYRDSIEQQLQGTATNLISLGITNYHGLQKFETLDVFVEEALQLEKINQIIQVFTRKGKLMFSSPAKTEPDIATSFKPTEKPSFKTEKIGNKKFRVLTTPYKAKNGKEYFLQIALPYPSFPAILRSASLGTGLLFFVLSLFALGAATLLSRRIIKPLVAIADYLRRLNPVETKEWPPLVMAEQDKHLNAIVSGINTLSRRVKSSLYSLSRISRYLAHELKNPLTILRGEAETALAHQGEAGAVYREALKSSMEEIDRMDNVVDTVSSLFKKERAAYRPAPCNLGVWVDGSIAALEKSLEGKIEWEKPAEKILADLDPDLLFSLIDNLVRNIRDHAGYRPQCRIALHKDNGKKEITVEDNGPGMSASLLEALNGGNPNDEKVGIGLSLCLEIATICHFELTFANGPIGGLSVTISV